MNTWVLALLLAVPGFAADGALVDLLPPGTKVVLGIRVRSIANSPLAKSAAGQALAMRPDVGAGWLKVASLAGFDPFRDIDEALIGSTAEGPDAPNLIAVRGSFNLARLAAGAESYAGVPVLRGAKGSNGVVALLDASTAIAGDPRSVRAAIDRRGKGARGDTALAGRIESLRGRYDIWGFGDRPEGFAGKGSPGANGLDSVDRFEFGVTVSRGLELAAQIHARSPEDVRKLAASLRLLETAVAAQLPSGSPAAFKAAMEDGTLKISLAIPEEELNKALKARAALGAPALPKITGDSPASTAARSGNSGGGTGVFTLPGRR